ncbi:MAG: type II toxin-antitoxin system RelE/ParE family toxin [Lachnospiraceae bacterium]|nr:type II toxin-antitoxin system RelE/ParE family toxin [Lachnospiraceae bacterium]
MGYSLLITDRAEELVDNLVGYLKNKLKNPDAALHLIDELDAVYDQLEKNPYQYPESSDDFLRSRGYRDALLREMSYRVVFRIEERTVYIVGVFHNLEDYGKKVE